MCDRIGSASGLGGAGATGVGAMEELPATAAEEIGLLLGRTLVHDECSVALVRAALVEHPAAQARYRLGVREGGRLAAVAIGTAGERREDGHGVPVGHLQALATDPRHRRRGHAARLLDALERRFAADGLREARVWGDFWAGVDVRYSAALCLLLRRGYTREQDVFNLAVELAGRDFSTAAEEAALAAAGFAVRRAASGDRADLDRYLVGWGPRWRPQVLRAFEQEPIGCHIALWHGQIVAFAANDVARPGWFGPTGVDVEHRGRGIGAVLLRRCLADWQRAGRKRGEISWIGPLYFYVTAVDAYVSRVLWQMRKPLADG